MTSSSKTTASWFSLKKWGSPTLPPKKQEDTRVDINHQLLLEGIDQVSGVSLNHTILPEPTECLQVRTLRHVLLHSLRHRAHNVAIPIGYWDVHDRCLADLFLLERGDLTQKEA